MLHRGSHFPKREMQLKAMGKQLRGAGDHAALLLAHGCASEWVAVLTRIREVDDREEIKAGLADTVDTAHRRGAGPDHAPWLRPEPTREVHFLHSRAVGAAAGRDPPGRTGGLVSDAWARAGGGL
ncbi:hypothetical protein KTAU_25690 [Thermogemmatispora aurantia]|uniref:Uncharacterized protein n=1 Tax=Thermogemmatispora aurantia TaxID=2045279 RepID=A0A5J4KA25_9CHLR|nr:hypothetical protein KTAU_25690 [Thermogemmatispora aurantia]